MRPLRLLLCAALLPWAEVCRAGAFVAKPAPVAHRFSSGLALPISAPTPSLALPSLPAPLAAPSLSPAIPVPAVPTARAAAAAQAVAAPSAAPAKAALASLTALSEQSRPSGDGRAASPASMGRMFFDRAAKPANAVAAPGASFGFSSALVSLFGSYNSRTLKAFQPLVDRSSALEAPTQALSDAALRSKTAEFRARLAKGESLDDILPEAFATVREAAGRVLKQRHRDVQTMAAVAMHKGMIAEMATGEGKTLAATMAVYLNALKGDGVHVFTVNDYLAKRDSQWMGSVYRFLGLSVGLVQNGMLPAARREAYAADITYGTATEFGFDYLRDNLAKTPGELVQRGHAFAVVDEVDSILIDQARTPLIISGAADEDLSPYARADAVARGLKVKVLSAREKRSAEAREADPGDGYDAVVDEKDHTAWLTDSGFDKAAAALGVPDIYTGENAAWMHYMNQALKAQNLYARDAQYIVKDGEVLIVDEFTGRIMEGRRWSDGLHQAVEAKEAVEVKQENRTLATVTLQNFILLYAKRAGMTGTAATSAAEFGKIYKLDVLSIPTHAPLIREDLPDIVYRTEAEKEAAVVAEIARLHAAGRPVLVGTVSPDKSERLAELLGGLGIPHAVLNAKHNEEEAEIVASAGRHKAVTIATNMAGRGTDIILGGSPHQIARRMYDEGRVPAEVPAGRLGPARAETAELVRYGRLGAEVDAEAYALCLAAARAVTDEERRLVLAAGGLAVIGTERHESRRIDDQLRGRAGRQGDPGSSRFFLSLQDRLMRMFGADNILRLLDAMGWPQGEAIESRMVERGVESAQGKVEGRDFEIRENVLKYDDVVDHQRRSIYARRRSLLDGSGSRDPGRGDSYKEVWLDAPGGTREVVLSMAEETARAAAKAYSDDRRRPEAFAALEKTLAERFHIAPNFSAQEAYTLKASALEAILVSQVRAAYEEAERAFGAERLRAFERRLLVDAIDEHWREQVLALEDLKQAVNLRVYAQLDPFVEYKKDSYAMFAEMLARIREQAVAGAFALRPGALSGEAGPVEDARSVALGKALLELRFEDLYPAAQK
ncbi:MAG: preprotein translocase subunit SecA [Elusimicrobia bacterium]|nr:preprotein translocase subunit SecA [Elusimicrobiota bacterium]